MAIVLGLRFVCEMAALAAVAYWGLQAAGGVAGIALAAIVVAVVWGVFLAPRRRVEVGLPARLVIELAVWVAAAAPLWSAGQPTLAVVLFVVAVVTGAINARGAATTAPA